MTTRHDTARPQITTLAYPQSSDLYAYSREAHQIAAIHRHATICSHHRGGWSAPEEREQLMINVMGHTLKKVKQSAQQAIGTDGPDGKLG